MKIKGDRKMEFFKRWKAKCARIKSDTPIMEKYCPLIKKKCIAQKCRCYDRSVPQCGFFDSLADLDLQIDHIEEQLEEIYEAIPTFATKEKIT